MNFDIQRLISNELNDKLVKDSLSNNESYILLDHISLQSYCNLPIISFSKFNTKNCVYLIECLFCKWYYVGQTSRIFKVRLKEHIRHINKHFQMLQIGYKYSYK
jgi:hypothetical protein